MNDGGYRSRKMVMAYVCLGLTTVAFFATARWPALIPAYMEYNLAVLAAASIYTGGNTLTKWIQARNAPKKKKVVAPAPPGPKLG